MSTAVTHSPPLEWRGDPTVLVYAVRYALGSHGSHAPELVRQALTVNVQQLTPAARRAITSDIQDWLDNDDGTATATERATWSRALAAVRIPRAQPNVTRKELHR